VTLSYGAVASDERVRVEAAFEANSVFRIGRTAVIAPGLPGAAPGTPGMLTGAAFGLADGDVRRRAFAELVERLSAFEAAFERPLHAVDSVEEARPRLAAPIVAPSALQHFDPRQRLPPYIDRSPDAGLRTLVEGFELRTGAAVLVPALAAFLTWRPPPEETLFLWPGATGLAAGRAAEEAIRRGLLEVIERDACMLLWRVRGAPRRLLPSSLAPEPLREVCSTLGLSVELYGVRTGRLPGTVIAALSTSRGDHLTCGSACGGFDASTAGKALSEALALQWTARSFTDDAVMASALPETSLAHVLRAFWDGSSVLANLRSDATPAGAKTEAEGPGSLADLVIAAEEVFACPVIVVDVTSRAARSSGWYVARVIVPGALPRESDARVAHLGGPRLRSLLGSEPLDSPALETAPHPFG